MFYLNSIFFWLNTGKNVDRYIIKPLKSIKHQRVWWWTRGYTIFHDLTLSCFYHIKAMSWITADYLQWIMYVKTKSRVYMCIKKTSTKLSKPSNPSLGKWKSISFIFVFYSLYFTSYCYPNTAVVVKGYYKCRFFNVHQSLWSPKVIRTLIINKIITFSLK